MKKYTKIKRAGHDRNERAFEEGELILKEKLDGCNFRFTVNEEGQFVFGSKNVEYKINGEPDYGENVDGRFIDAIEYIRDRCDPEDFDKDKTYFGENMKKHSLDYEYDTNPPPQVIMFDVYDHEEERYLSTEEAYGLLDEQPLELAPIVDRFEDASEFDPSEYEIPESNYRDGKMEGVVIINIDKDEDSRSGFSTRAKTVTDEFAEKHKKATGANQSKEAIHGHEKLVSKYCTDGRIRKHIEKMKDDGREFGMELMASQDGVDGLPLRVSSDILEEEAEEIVTRNDAVNFKDFRDLVADRCVHVLRQEIEKNVGDE